MFAKSVSLIDNYDKYEPHLCHIVDMLLFLNDLLKTHYSASMPDMYN